MPAGIIIEIFLVTPLVISPWIPPGILARTPTGISPVILLWISPKTHHKFPSVIPPRISPRIPLGCLQKIHTIPDGNSSINLGVRPRAKK